MPMDSMWEVRPAPELNPHFKLLWSHDDWSSRSRTQTFQRFLNLKEKFPGTEPIDKFVDDIATERDLYRYILGSARH